MHPCQNVNGAYVLEEKCRSLLRGYDFLYCLNFFYSKHCFYNEETTARHRHFRRKNPVPDAVPVPRIPPLCSRPSPFRGKLYPSSECFSDLTARPTKVHPRTDLIGAGRKPIFLQALLALPLEFGRQSSKNMPLPGTEASSSVCLDECHFLTPCDLRAGLGERNWVHR